MVDKLLFLLAVSVYLCTSVAAQTEHWTTVRFGKLQCDFPKAYTPIDYTGASGIYYDGGNMYLTVTAQPDTSSMKGNLDRDYTRDFMVIVADVSRKLNGRVREFRDTVVANMPGFISKMEVSFNGRNSYYELLQVLEPDTMRSFSCQYFIGDAEGLKAAQRLFQSVQTVQPKSSKGGLGKYGFWIGGSVVVLFGIWALVRMKTH